MTRPDLPVREDPPGAFADAGNDLRLGFAILKVRNTPWPMRTACDPAGMCVWLDLAADRRAGDGDRNSVSRL
jgi:hypothetical protein